MDEDKDRDRLPDWILQARRKWQYTGRERPEFAGPAEAGQQSVWDYPRPPAVARETRRVRVEWRGRLVAESRSALKVMETANPPTFYIPPDDVDLTCLTEHIGQTVCEWKGTATWYDLSVAGLGLLTGCAWAYREPFSPYEPLARYIAFYPHQLVCTLDGRRAVPQPGEVYGGWITDELVGPFKGAPGTEWW